MAKKAANSTDQAATIKPIKIQVGVCAESNLAVPFIAKIESPVPVPLASYQVVVILNKEKLKVQGAALVARMHPAPEAAKDVRVIATDGDSPFVPEVNSICNAEIQIKVAGKYEDYILCVENVFTMFDAAVRNEQILEIVKTLSAQETVQPEAAAAEEDPGEVEDLDVNEVVDDSEEGDAEEEEGDAEEEEGDDGEAPDDLLELNEDGVPDFEVLGAYLDYYGTEEESLSLIAFKIACDETETDINTAEYGDTYAALGKALNEWDYDVEDWSGGDAGAGEAEEGEAEEGEAEEGEAEEGEAEEGEAEEGEAEEGEAEEESLNVHDFAAMGAELDGLAEAEAEDTEGLEDKLLVACGMLEIDPNAFETWEEIGGAIMEAANADSGGKLTVAQLKKQLDATDDVVELRAIARKYGASNTRLGKMQKPQLVKFILEKAKESGAK